MNNNTIVENDEIYYTSYMKVILMLIIVLYHSLIFMNGNWFSPIAIETQVIPTYITRWLNTFHIQSFTFISGYIFFYLKNEKNHYNDFKSFFKKKVKRLIIPYLFVSTITLVPIDIFFNGFSLERIFHNYILGESPAQLWFLLMLFFVFIIFYPLSNIFEKKYSFLIILLLYLFGVIGSKFLPNYFQIWTSLKYLSFFYFGFFYRKNNLKLMNIPFYIWFIIDLIIFSSICLLENNEGVFFDALRIFLNYSVSLIGCIMTWTFFSFIFVRPKSNNFKIFSSLSKSTMIVYLFHQQIIYIIIWLLYGKMNIYLIFILNFIISLVICVFLSIIILKNKFLCILVGEKYNYEQQSL